MEYLIIMREAILGNLNKVKGMVMELNIIIMAQHIKVNDKMIWNMEKVNLQTEKVFEIKVSLKNEQIKEIKKKPNMK